jgi:hypothetical protein
VGRARLFLLLKSILFYLNVIWPTPKSRTTSLVLQQARAFKNIEVKIGSTSTHGRRAADAIFLKFRDYTLEHIYVALDQLWT